VDWPDPDVIAAIGHRLLQLLEPMGAAADQALPAQQAAGERRWQVSLAQMNPVGVHRQGQIHPVVDQEQGTMPGAELAQGAGFGEALAVLGLLGAVLHQPNPRLQGRRHGGLQPR